MPTFASDQMLGATAISATLAYIVPNSASPDGSTGYLSRTPAGASGNSQFWISVWIKLGKVGVQQEICSAYGGGTGLYIRLLSTHELQIQNYAGTVYKKSTPLYRDPTGWAHLFLSFDGSTDIDGWWNGAAIAWGTNGTLPSSYDWHNNVLHRIFSPAHDVSSLWTGYAAHFASGSGAVGDVNDCGEADGAGNWVPKNLTGLTFGTNGFWLKFENGADLGEDSSGVTPSASYTNRLGSGNRTAAIAVTAEAGSGSWNDTPDSLLVDGDTATNAGAQPATAATDATGMYMRFDFGVGAAKYFTELKYHWQNTNADPAQFKWQGSNDASSWSDMSATENWYPGGTTTAVTGNNGPWRYVQRIGVSGDPTGANILREVDFKIYEAGEGNNWTVNGTITQTTDTPTDDAANDIGSFPVWNVLSTARHTVTNGNLTADAAGLYTDVMPATFPIPGDANIYAEVTINTSGMSVGIVDKDIVPRSASIGLRTALATIGGVTYSYERSNGNAYQNDGSSAYGASYTTGVIGVYYNNGVLVFYKDGVSQGTAFSGINTGKDWFIAVASAGGSGKATLNVGQTPFVYTPPSGAVPLCTANLPAPASAASVTPLTGSVTCNGTTDNAFVFLGYTPDTAGSSTLGGSALVWGTHAIPTAGGFKIISASFNGSVAYSIAVERPFGGDGVSQARAQ